MSEQPQGDQPTNRQDVVVTNCLIPENAVATSVVEVVEFLDEDCERSYAFRFTGSSSVSTILGLLELAKINVIQSADFGG